MTLKKPPANRSKLKNVALFSEEDDTVSSSQSILLSKITLPEQQPRRYFDPQKLAGLVESIKQHGILESLLVRPLKSDTYELVAGERRYRAAKEIGLAEVPIVIRAMSDADALQIALIENLQREDLNPVEETEGILQLLRFRLEKPESEVISLLYRMSDEAKGKVPHNVMGNSEVVDIQNVFDGIALMEWQSFVANRLPLLKLPKDVLDLIRQGGIAYTKAVAIARLKDEPQRQILLKATMEENLSLSQIRERLKTFQVQPDITSPRSVVEAVSRRVIKAKLWENPKKWRQVQALLAKIESLVIEK